MKIDKDKDMKYGWGCIISITAFVVIVLVLLVCFW